MAKVSDLLNDFLKPMKEQRDSYFSCLRLTKARMVKWYDLLMVNYMSTSG